MSTGKRVLLQLKLFSNSKQVLKKVDQKPMGRKKEESLGNGNGVTNVTARKDRNLEAKCGSHVRRLSKSRDSFLSLLNCFICQHCVLLRPFSSYKGRLYLISFLPKELSIRKCCPHSLSVQLCPSHKDLQTRRPKLTGQAFLVQYPTLPLLFVM